MTDNKVEEVKKKIEKIKEEQFGISPKKDASSPIIDIASELVAGVIVGVIIGILLDKLFSSKPLFLIICVILASIAAFRSIWKKYIKIHWINMKHSPLDQFKIKEIANIQLFGHDVVLTNSAFFMILASFFIILYFTLAFKSKKLVPTRLQLSGELFYSLITDAVNQNVGVKGKKFVPFVFTLFMFIMVCNLFGMIPYGFTVTSHISVTFALAMMVFLLVTLLGFILHGFHFLSLFLSAGTPWWLAPLMILIELFAYLARPVSLSLRLAANMVAGHVLIKVIASFIVSMAFYLKIVPIPFVSILIGFEIFVAILQAYIFTILSCVYLNDAINLHWYISIAILLAYIGGGKRWYSLVLILINLEF